MSCVGETVLVAGGSGYAGALAARILHRHPHFELAAVTSRSDVGVRLDELYPHHRVPLVLDDPLVQLDPTSHHDLLDVLARVSQRTQVVLLTEDRVVTSWARHRADRGEVRLVDLDGQAG